MVKGKQQTLTSMFSQTPPQTPTQSPPQTPIQSPPQTSTKKARKTTKQLPLKKRITAYFPSEGGYKDPVPPESSLFSWDPKDIAKNRRPYILEILRHEKATTEEHAVPIDRIMGYFGDLDVANESLKRTLREMKEKGHVAINWCGKYYITESGIKELEECERKKASQKGMTEGEKALILSLHYLGATRKENAVMRSDAINEGKNFTKKFHPTSFDGGKYNHGKSSMNKLSGKGIVRRGRFKTTGVKAYFLTEKGNKVASVLLREEPHLNDSFTILAYKDIPALRVIKKAILCILHANEATSEESGVIYPFIIAELNHLIVNTRDLYNKYTTPEYGALFELVMIEGLVEKSIDKGKQHKFFLTKEGERAVEKILGEPDVQKCMKRIMERREASSREEEEEIEIDEENDAVMSFKRARDVDDAAEGSPESKRAKMSPDVPSTPLRNPRQPESAQREEDIESMDESPRKEMVQSPSYSSEIYIPADEYEFRAMSEAAKARKRERKDREASIRAELAKIDRKNALKYPPLKVYQVFSTPPFNGAIVPPRITEVKLIVDSNEPKYLRKAIKSRFTKEGLDCEEKKLNAGDYTWVAIGADGKEYLLNAIVERKAISDFDGSYRFGGRYLSQVSKMRASGVSNLLYLIEGVANRENSFHNKSFDGMQQCIRNVQEENRLRLIRTLNQWKTIDFLVDITKSLNEMAKGGRLTGNFFARPISVEDMNNRIEELSRLYSNNQLSPFIGAHEILSFLPEYAQRFQRYTQLLLEQYS